MKQNLRTSKGKKKHHHNSFRNLSKNTGGTMNNKTRLKRQIAQINARLKMLNNAKRSVDSQINKLGQRVQKITQTLMETLQ
jgi:vacuolar-type H+-ATPase subunit E/Vma4